MTSTIPNFRRSKLQYTGRAFRQDADQAMRSDIFRGLVEAITNADDAYRALPGEIAIRVSRARGKAWNVSVTDQATGIPLGEMEQRLGSIGARTSGFEQGAPVRGNRGRGAKDLAAYGAVRWESIVDDQCGVLEIERDGRYRVARQARPADRDLRARLGIARNGTRVTVFCRGNVPRPRFETLLNKIERLVPLRDIMQRTDRVVTLTYLDDAPYRLHYAPDDTLKHVASQQLEMSGYPGVAQLDLYEAREPLPGGPGDLTRENGILIKSGGAVHEATLFGFEMDPYGALFTGTVRWETIDGLVRDFDERDERGRPPSQSNPFAIISRMRDGLEKTHPAYEALRSAVEPVLAEHIARRRAEDANLAAETPQTRRRLTQLARVVSRFSLDKEEELDLELSSGAGGDAHVPAVRIVPQLKRLEFGETATLTLIARREAVRALPAKALLEVTCEPRGGIGVWPPELAFEEDAARGILRAEISIKAHEVRASATIIATVENLAPSVASVEVIEPLPETEEPSEEASPAAFSFQYERYAVDLGKRRLLRLMAPADVVERNGAVANVSTDHPEALVLRDERTVLRRVAGGWYQARICVEGKAELQDVRVVARLGDFPTEATALVRVGREASSPAMTIEIGQFGGFARARWQRDPDGNVTATINAAHPAAQRYLGDPPEYVGQDSPLARMLIAEIVAEEVVRDLLSRRYRGARVDADAYAADRQRLLADLLPRCHTAQLSAAEAEAFLHRDTKLHTPRPARPERRRRQPELFE